MPAVFILYLNIRLSHFRNAFCLLKGKETRLHCPKERIFRLEGKRNLISIREKHLEGETLTNVERKYSNR